MSLFDLFDRTACALALSHSLHHRVWPDDLVSAACEAASSIHPLNKEESRVFTDYPTAEGPVLQRQPMFDACNNFPFDSTALNAVSLHPRILGAVAQVLEKPVHQVRVTQAALNGKYGPETPRADGVQFEFSWNNRDGNQPMHQDYGALAEQHPQTTLRTATACPILNDYAC